MAVNLTVSYPFGNGTRLVTRVKRAEDDGFIEVNASIRSAAATDITYAQRTGFIRNGASDRFSRVTLAPGQSAVECLAVNPGYSTPTGYTDALAALNTSKAAFEAYLLTSGILDSSLVGT